MTIHRLHRVYDLHRPEPIRVEIHDHDCDCPACAPYLQPAAPLPRSHLTFAELGWLAALGMAIGHVIAFAYDPHGAWLALTTMFAGGR
ncbi:hypothetical protein [Sphingomonas bacterium]|uniref:hypothetical protein n=1 Tax=Sphingomonas bacterium TaxID=1895847 RepID=UPI001575F310|nr:hypothetical protein [Sphingomonas bacterium]